MVRRGSGPPALLVHGAAADHATWTLQLHGLDDAFTLVAYDRRVGQGITTEDHADDAAALLARDGVKVAAITRYPGFANSPRAHIINQRTMEVFRDLGIENRVTDAAMPASLMNQVIWAMCTRFDPQTDMELLHGCWSTSLDPMAYSHTDPRNNRLVIDACRPWQRRDTFPIVARSSEQLDDRIRAKWAHILPRGK